MKKYNRKSNRKSNTKSRKRQQTASKRRISNKKTKRTIKNRRKSSRKFRKQQKSKSIRIKKQIKKKNMKGGQIDYISQAYFNMLRDKTTVSNIILGKRLDTTNISIRKAVETEVEMAEFNIMSYFLNPQHYVLTSLGYTIGRVTYQFSSRILLIDFQNLNYRINGNGNSVNYHKTINWIEGVLLNSLQGYSTCFVVLPGVSSPVHRPIRSINLFYIYVDCQSMQTSFDCWKSTTSGGYGFNESDDYVLLYIYTIISYNSYQLPVRILSADRYGWYNYQDPSTNKPIRPLYFNFDGSDGYRHPDPYYRHLLGIQP